MSENKQLDEYRELLRKLTIMSQVAVGQFLGGSRPAEDPRVEYIRGLEAFKNVANAQISAFFRLATENLGVPSEEFIRVSCEELETQVKEMMEDFRITGWDDDGNPVFDLQSFRERTAGWPP